MMKRFLLLATIVVCMCANVSLFAEASVAGDWHATIKLPSTELPLVIHLKSSESGWSGTLDTPSQGGFGIPMTKVDVSEGQLTFEIASLYIHYEGKVSGDKKTIQGTFMQGAPIPLTFSRPEDKRSSRLKTSESAAVVGTWSGVIKIPNYPLTLVIHVSEDGSKLTAKAESPDQHSNTFPVDTVELNDGKFSFAMNKLDASYDGVLLEDGKSIEGIFTQKGNQFSLNLTPGRVKKN
ncbi:hypothetical protein [Pleionea sediminis]|uniref:hypothetical protein n=1 Tax=Pleionea sediminis TaxID=2569479 RepID=UPI001185183A|nr:hypothetical protein [Pleionea sediminis]